MDIDNFFTLLFSLYAEQEGVSIEYEIDDYFFSTDCFNEKRFLNPSKAA